MVIFFKVIIIQTVGSLNNQSIYQRGAWYIKSFFFSPSGLRWRTFTFLTKLHFALYSVYSIIFTILKLNRMRTFDITSWLLFLCIQWCCQQFLGATHRVTLEHHEQSEWCDYAAGGSGVRTVSFNLFALPWPRNG